MGKKAAHRFANDGHLRFVSVPWLLKTCDKSTFLKRECNFERRNREGERERRRNQQAREELLERTFRKSMAFGVDVWKRGA